MSVKFPQSIKTTFTPGPEATKSFSFIVFGFLSVLVVAVNKHARTTASHPYYDALIPMDTGILQNTTTIRALRQAGPQICAQAITTQTADSFAGLPTQQCVSPEARSK